MAVRWAASVPGPPRKDLVANHQRCRRHDRIGTHETSPLHTNAVALAHIYSIKLLP
jgi:hypothetical protein